MHCRGILNFNCDAFNPTLCALITEALLLCLLVSFTYLLIYPPVGFILSTNQFDQFVNLLFYCNKYNNISRQHSSKFKQKLSAICFFIESVKAKMELN